MCINLCNVFSELIDEVVVERPRLENAPLKAVICQVQIPRILDLADDEVRPIQKALSDSYPRLREEHAVELTLEAPSPQALLSPSGQAHRVYRFDDSDLDWTATLAPEALSLETTAYIGMKDFLSRWVEFASVAMEFLGLSAQNRIGLRYINELPCPGTTREALDGWVRDELIGLVGAHKTRTSSLIRTLSQSQFRQPDGNTCNVRYGIAPSANDGESLFLLDFDYFEEESGEFDLAQQVRTLASFNEGIYELFGWSFSEETRESFGPEVPTGGGHA